MVHEKRNGNRYMKNINLTLYEFKELPQDIQDKLVKEYSPDNISLHILGMDYKDTIKGFIGLFPDLQCRGGTPIFHYVHPYLMGLKGLRLRTWLINNIKLTTPRFITKNGRTRKSNILLQQGQPLTGEYLDDFVMGAIRNMVKWDKDYSDTNIESLVLESIQDLDQEYNKLKEHYSSEEYAKSVLSELWFTKDGKEVGLNEE